MRVLFSAPPSTGHLLPALPTLQALRAAGHGVLVVAYGENASQYLRLGLSVTDVSDGATLAQMYDKHVPGRRFGNPGLTAEQIFEAPARANAELSRRSVTPLLQLVRDWNPDLLIGDPFQGAVPLVGAITKVPVVEHQSGVADGRVLARTIGAHLHDLYRDHDLPGPPASVSIQVAPPSLVAPDAHAWHVRYVSQHGSALVPADLLGPGDRTQVVVTFGTVIDPDTRNQRLAQLMSVLGRCDAEFLLPATADADPEAIGTVPSNVRLLPFVPVSELLRHSHAIVHHGGAGTLLSAIAAGTPQLIVPNAGDQFLNSELAHRHGFGIGRSAIDQIDAAVIDQLLTSERLRAGATAIQAENAAQPTPAQLVPRLEELVAG